MIRYMSSCNTMEKREEEGGKKRQRERENLAKK
jgi:hypothetical protein